MDRIAALTGLLLVTSLGVAGYTIVYAAIIKPIFFPGKPLPMLIKINLYIWILIVAFIIGFSYTYK